MPSRHTETVLLEARGGPLSRLSLVRRGQLLGAKGGCKGSPSVRFEEFPTVRLKQFSMTHLAHPALAHYVMADVDTCGSSQVLEEDRSRLEAFPFLAAGQQAMSLGPHNMMNPAQHFPTLPSTSQVSQRVQR